MSDSLATSHSQLSGEFRAGLDPGHAASTLFALIVGLDRLSLLDSSGEDIADRSDAALELVMPALAAADTPKARCRSI